jgi:hypothetical protein
MDWELMITPALVVANVPVLLVCRFAIRANLVFLLVSLVPLFYVLNEMQRSAEAGLALPAALTLTCCFAVAWLAFVAIYRWRLR